MGRTEKAKGKERIVGKNKAKQLLNGKTGVTCQKRRNGKHMIKKWREER